MDNSDEIISHLLRGINLDRVTILISRGREHMAWHPGTMSWSNLLECISIHLCYQLLPSHQVQWETLLNKNMLPSLERQRLLNHSNRIGRYILLLHAKSSSSILFLSCIHFSSQESGHTWQYLVGSSRCSCAILLDRTISGNCLHCWLKF